MGIIHTSFKSLRVSWEHYQWVSLGQEAQITLPGHTDRSQPDSQLRKTAAPASPGPIKAYRAPAAVERSKSCCFYKQLGCSCSSQTTIALCHSTLQQLSTPLQPLREFRN